MFKNAHQLTLVRKAGLVTAAMFMVGGCTQTTLPDGRTVFHVGMPQQQAMQQPGYTMPYQPVSPAMSSQPVGPTEKYVHREGRYTLTADLTPVGGDRYKGSVGVGTAGCGGGVEGPVTRRGNVYTLVNNDPQSHTMCRVTMVVQGRSMTASEDDCGNWHGASCEFNGKLTRSR